MANSPHVNQARPKLRNRLLFLCLFGALPLCAGNRLPAYLDFQQLGLNEGLSQSTISHLFQDREGFMWVSTQDGLNRYDGYNFQVYRHRSFDSSSLPSGEVISVFQQRDGTIWVSTTKGIARLDLDGTHFTRFPHPSLTFNRIGQSNPGFLEDSAGHLWIFGARNGGYLLQLKNDQLIEYVGPNASRQGQVTALKEGHQGQLWAVFDHQLLHYDAQLDTFEEMSSLPEIPEEGRPFWLGTDIHIDDFNQLWLNGAHGIYQFDPETGTFTYYPAPEDNVRISGFLEDKAGLFWCTTGPTIFHFDPQDGSYREYKHDPNDPQSAPQVISRGLVSRFGVLWLTTLGQGVARYDRAIDGFIYSQTDITNPQAIPSNFLTTLFEDRSGTIWFGGPDTGLIKHSPSKRKFRHYLHPHRQPKPLSNPMVWSLLVDNKGDTWVGTGRDGLLHLDKARENILEQFFPNTLVRALFQDPKGTIWFASNDGAGNQQLVSLDPKTGFTHPWLATDAVVFRPIPDGSGFLVSCFGSGLYRFTYANAHFERVAPDIIQQAEIADYLQDGRILVGNRTGLLLYDPKTAETLSFGYDETNRNGLSWDRVMSIHQEANGFVWVSLSGGGLNRFDPKTYEFRHFSLAQGLPNNFVYCILGDDNGNLWLSSNGGLSRFDPKTEVFRNFDVHDGLQSMEFNMGSAFKAADGELLFGGVAGFNAFYPSEVKINPNPPMLTLTPWTRSGQHTASLATTGRINLPAGEPVLSFTYAGLDYVEPRKNAYAYRLSGFDNDWNHVGKQRKATYTNLPGGDYVFYVKAANSDGVWSEQPSEIRVTVAPHFYETRSFFFSAAITFMGLLVLAYLRERRRLHRRQEEALLLRDHMRKSEELEFARQIQLAMIPKKDVNFGEAVVMGQMITATEVGGDYFDFFHLDDKRLCIAYGDATGHGVAAGLVVGMVKLAATVWAMHPKGIADMMIDLNNGLRKTLPLKTMGMGFGLAVLDLSTYEVEICSCGMPFPYLYSAATGQLQPLVLKGPPLGYLKRIKPASTHISLANGDRLIFTSDGFMERFNNDGRLWGEKALAASLRRACQEMEKPEKVAQTLIEDCNQFASGRPCDDDMTIVVLQRGQEVGSLAAVPNAFSPAEA